MKTTGVTVFLSSVCSVPLWLPDRVANSVICVPSVEHYEVMAEVKPSYIYIYIYMVNISVRVTLNALCTNS